MFDIYRKDDLSWKKEFRKEPFTDEEIKEAKEKYCKLNSDLLGIFVCDKCDHHMLFPSNHTAPDINMDCPNCGKPYRVKVGEESHYDFDEDKTVWEAAVLFEELPVETITCKCGHKGTHEMYLENPIAECKECGTFYFVGYSHGKVEVTEETEEGMKYWESIHVDPEPF